MGTRPRRIAQTQRSDRDIEQEIAAVYNFDYNEDKETERLLREVKESEDDARAQARAAGRPMVCDHPSIVPSLYMMSGEFIDIVPYCHMNHLFVVIGKVVFKGTVMHRGNRRLYSPAILSLDCNLIMASGCASFRG